MKISRLVVDLLGDALKSAARLPEVRTYVDKFYASQDRLPPTNFTLGDRGPYLGMSAEDSDVMSVLISHFMLMTLIWVSYEADNEGMSLSLDRNARETLGIAGDSVVNFVTLMPIEERNAWAKSMEETSSTLIASGKPQWADFIKHIAPVEGFLANRPHPLSCCISLMPVDCFRLDCSTSMLDCGLARELSLSPSWKFLVPHHDMKLFDRMNRLLLPS